MKALSLLFLLALPSSAAPGALDFERMSAAAGSAGFVLPRVAVPLTREVPTAPEADTARVDLAPLLDRHLSLADSFTDRVGRHLIAVTLDQTEPDGAWISITPPGMTPKMILIEAGMRAEWSAGGRNYLIRMDISIFRSRLNNIIEVYDADEYKNRDAGASTIEPLWSKRIIELMGISYRSGEPIVIAGRPYRMFLAHMPDASRRPAVPSSTLGLCLIYDQTVDGKHVEYFTYRFLIPALQRPDGAMAVLYGGDRARLKAAPDLSVIEISR